MFSYGLWEGVGEVFNFAEYHLPLPKKLRKSIFFLWFGILTTKILALAIWWYQAKKIQYLDISLLAVGSLISYIALKIWTV